MKPAAFRMISTTLSDEASDSDEGELNFKSGPLSHISERSEEYAGSAVGSVYHSVDGSAVGSEVRAESSQELRNSEFHEIDCLI